MSNPSAALEETAGMRRTLVQLSDRVYVVQAALVMAIEGKSRASATEVANRVRQEHSTIVTASKVGIILSGYGVRSVRSGGRGRLILEPEQLRGVVRRLREEADAIGPAVDEVVNKFEDVADVVESMKAQISRVRYLGLTQRDMKQYLDKHRMTIGGLYYLEKQYEQARQQVQRASDLQTAIESLAEQVKGLPELDARQQALQKVINGRAAAVRVLDLRDREMVNKQSRLDQRTNDLNGQEKRLAQERAAIDLVDLERTIAEKKKDHDDEVRGRERELKNLDKQIKSKRSLLDRVLGRDEASS